MSTTARWDADEMLVWWRVGMGSPPATGVWTAAVGLQALNEAQKQLAAAVGERLPWLVATETVTTVAGTAEYELTAGDVLKAVGVTNEDGVPLEQKDQGYSRRADFGASTDPWAWYPSAGSNDGAYNVTLLGTPSVAGKVLTVHYVMLPTPLVATSDTEDATFSQLPEIFDGALVQYAVQFCLAFAGQPKRSADAKQAMADILGNAARMLPGPVEHIDPITSTVLEMIDGMTY